MDTHQSFRYQHLELRSSQYGSLAGLSDVVGGSLYGLEMLTLERNDLNWPDMFCPPLEYQFRPSHGRFGRSCRSFRRFTNVREYLGCVMVAVTTHERGNFRCGRKGRPWRRMTMTTNNEGARVRRAECRVPASAVPG